MIRALALLLCISPVALDAQRFLPEVRVDAHGPDPYSVEPGLGAWTALGTYVRVGPFVAYDVTDRRAEGRLRGDVLARFSFDPFRQSRWGFSAGGGLTFRERQTRIVVVLDLEGPAIGGWSSAFQLGAGGGARFGVGARRSVRGRR